MSNPKADLYNITHSLLKIRVSVTNHNRIGNSVDPDETACYEPSHLDLPCLQKYLYSPILVCWDESTCIGLQG